MSDDRDDEDTFGGGSCAIHGLHCDGLNLTLMRKDDLGVANIPVGTVRIPASDAAELSGALTAHDGLTKVVLQ